MVKEDTMSVMGMVFVVFTTVIAVVMFQHWYNTVSTQMYSENEQSSEVKISPIGLIDGNTLYFTNPLSEEIQINSIKIENIDCKTVPIQIQPRITKELDVSNCIEKLSSGKKEVVVYTNKRIISKELFIKIN